MPDWFEYQFLANGAWWGEARCLAADFHRNDDGSYVASTPGSPIIFRCIALGPGWFIHADGGGQLYTYRLVDLGVPPE
ncbi:hypothetical protein HJD18_09805 [Thermoleophilia bacterium SCSIO 60948]|nr:hypothetical protein HJD18_09805 [Thermoleophilia bacterium SCSIO 60948]